MPGNIKNVIVIGAGFAGLRVCQGLRDVPVNVVLVDRHNYHLFQPLLYQVASAALSPADIAFPIRRIFRKQKNVECVLGDVSHIDLARRCITLDGQEADYDYVVIGTGATHSYFGQDTWLGFAPGLKTIDDAIAIRKRILLAFEEAENESDVSARVAKLTFVVVGGGPTGVELAGALRQVAADEIQKDYRNIDTSTTRVILVEANDRVLKTFDPKLSARALRDLQRLGVEVRLMGRVTSIDEHGVNIGDERIEANNVFWAAGVAASPLGKTLGVPLDRAGRVIVKPDLSVPGYPGVFVAGDLASVTNIKTNTPVPGVAPAAMQMGAYVAKIIRQEVMNDIKPEDRAPFGYHDKGSMATIGKARAVADIAGWKFGGLVAWLMWSVIHLMFLITFRSRMGVMVNWIYTYLFHSAGARLITGEFKPRVRKFRDVTPNF
ncbi:MAG: NAD(P)/FAD-dependent oxidoreductase [Anaerolineae bacterium]|nr:NAD(P)/FAD-dependent oxidoreductase [Phycisphaerae bacterium]